MVVSKGRVDTRPTVVGRVRGLLTENETPAAAGRVAYSDPLSVRRLREARGDLEALSQRLSEFRAEFGVDPFVTSSEQFDAALVLVQTEPFDLAGLTSVRPKRSGTRRNGRNVTGGEPSP